MHDRPQWAPPRFAAVLFCAASAAFTLWALPGRALAAPEQKKLAVLEFAVDLVDKSQIDRLYFASAVQGAVQRLLPPQQYFIMTRENLQELLRGQGKSLEECVGNCEVETGRLLSADLVIAGRLSRVGARIKLALTLYQVASGQLLGTTIASGDTPEKLDDDLTGKVEELVSSLLPASGGRPPGTQPIARPRPQQAILFVTSVPDGAAVKLDGQQAGTTPLSMPLRPGTYTVEASLPGYLPRAQEVALAASEEPTRVQLALTRQEGKLSIASNESCRGTAGERSFSVEQGNLVLVKVPTGPAQISCATGDGRTARAQASVSEGELASVKLRFDPPAPVVQREPDPPAPSDEGPSAFKRGLDRRLGSGLTWGFTFGMGSMAAAGTGSGFGLSGDLQLRLADTLILEGGVQNFTSGGDHTAGRLGAMVQPFAVGPLIPYAGARFISDTGDLADGYSAVAGLGLELGAVFAFEVSRGLTGGVKDSTTYMVVMLPKEGFKF